MNKIDAYTLKKKSKKTPKSLLILPTTRLENSPSSKNGISNNEEKQHRFFGCELIQEGGILLKCPQPVMITGQAILQRFYYHQSLKDYDVFLMAMTSLFLASKLEEKPKRIRDIINVFYNMFLQRKCVSNGMSRDDFKSTVIDYMGMRYTHWKDRLIQTERQILLDFGFCMYNLMDHPHKYILHFIKILDGSSKLAQMSWNYLNDSCRLDLCTRFLPQVIASAALFHASKILNICLPTHPPWYILFDTSFDEISVICKEIEDMYQMNKIEWLTPQTHVDPYVISEGEKYQIYPHLKPIQQQQEFILQALDQDQHQQENVDTTLEIPKQEIPETNERKRNGTSRSRERRSKQSSSRNRSRERRHKRSSSRSCERRRERSSSRERRRKRSRDRYDRRNKRHSSHERRR